MQNGAKKPKSKDYSEKTPNKKESNGIKPNIKGLLEYQ